MAAKVWISVGHGGNGDTGAINGEIHEYTECAAVGKRAVEILQECGVNVELVPLAMTLKARTKWINQRAKGTELLVELHINSNTPGRHGANVLYYTGNTYAEQVAIKMVKAYAKTVGVDNNGPMPDKDTRFKRLGIIRDTIPEAWLLEQGYVSSLEDIDKIRRDGALGVANVVMTWLNLPLLEKNPMGTETQQVSSWAKPTMEKVLKTQSKNPDPEIYGKPIIEDWSRPQDPVTAEWLKHILFKRGLVDSNTGLLTKEQCAVALDRDGFFDR